MLRSIRWFIEMLTKIGLLEGPSCKLSCTFFVCCVEGQVHLNKIYNVTWKDEEQGENAEDSAQPTRVLKLPIHLQVNITNAGKTVIT